jgi:DNA-binding MarR family transcriptional regulator
VTALIDRLEHVGYVARERGSQDRRRVTVRAFPEKLREIARLYAPHYRRMSKLLAKYSEEEFRAITDYLAHASIMLAVDDRV